MLTKSSAGNKIKLLPLLHCVPLLFALLFSSVLSVVNSPTAAAFIAAPLSLIITLETGNRVRIDELFYCHILCGATAVDSSWLWL